MKRELHQSTAFGRSLRRWLKKHPEADEPMHAILAALAENAFQPSLGTHKLKGKWSSYHACSTGYDLRIVFEFFQHHGVEAIQLVEIGTHEEVY